MQTMREAEATVTGERGYGGQSMTGRLRAVLVRRPAPPATGDEWRALGYPRPVDAAVAEREHAAFRALLAQAGAEVIEAGPDGPGQLDAIFAYDPSIMTDAGAILLRMGKPLRLGETDLAAAEYAKRSIPVLGRIMAPGTVEGGDTLWLDERTLAVGRGYRTNDAGIAQLTTILAGIGVDVLPVALPHWHGPDECLHLMSLISPVAADLAVVYPPLLATAFVEELQGRGWGFIEVPDEEFDSLGCNVLALGLRRCLVCDGNPITRSRLEAAGCEVVAYTGTEISLNRAGGPTCLTRPIWRED
jgi:dimethylargininase